MVALPYIISRNMSTRRKLRVIKYDRYYKLRIYPIIIIHISYNVYIDIYICRYVYILTLAVLCNRKKNRYKSTLMCTHVTSCIPNLYYVE